MYPAYQDFGKSTKDFFTKGFQTGSYKLNIKDIPTRHIKATITGAHNIEKQVANGDFQAELTCPVLPGFISTTKWTTANTVRHEISIKDLLLCGLTTALEAQYNIESASIEGKFKPSYKHPKLTVDALFAGGDSINPSLGASLVSGYKNFAGGYQVEYDPIDNNLKKSNVSGAYVNGPISLYTSMENADVLWGGLVYRNGPTLELGITGTYKAQPEGFAVFGAAVKYVMDCCTAFKAKVDSDLQIGLGFETKIRPNATVTCSGKIDGNRLNEGGHTIGLSFDLEC